MIIFIKLLYLIVALPLIVHCITNHEFDELIKKSQWQEHIKTVQKLAEQNKIIDKVLKPYKISEGGYLGEGDYGFSWKCDVDGKMLAVKFVLYRLKESVDREYRNYAALKAVNTTDSEIYGIPGVFFRGIIRIETVYFDAIGMKFLKGDFMKLMNDERMKSYDSETDSFYQLSDAFAINILISIQETMITLARAHDLGVSHNDLKPENHRTEGHRMYLIDWNSGQRQDDKVNFPGGTQLFASRRGVEGKRRKETDEIESLFLESLDTAGADIPIDDETTAEHDLEFRNNMRKLDACCRTVHHSKLKNFFIEFRKEAFYVPERPYPRYVKIYKLAKKFTKKIHMSDEPVYFSWLTDEEKAFARANPPPKLVVEGPKEHYHFDELPPFPDPRKK